ncbi:MAG: hypothetical protein ACI4RA_04795 [Kiritimatiellia bacterium]
MKRFEFLLLSVCALVFGVGAWDGQFVLHTGDSGHSPERIQDAATAGVRFTAERTFSAVSACCPSYGNNVGGLTLALYPWAGSVEASRARGALETKRFENFADNATLVLAFGPRPAGVYYAELSQGTETVGVWKARQGAEGVQAFLNGAPVTDGCYEFAVTLTGLAVPFYGERALYELLSGPTLAPAETDGVSDEHGALIPNRAFAARDLEADTWDAMDGLGRALGSSCTHPAPRPKKKVGLFYWTWHEAHTSARNPRNNAEILAADPTLAERPDDPKWGPFWQNHHWDEPLFGYYRTTDAWVSRRHAQMLAEAGVDTVVFDATNGDLTWMDSFWTFAKTWASLRRDGLRTPQFVYMLPFGAQPVQVVSLLQLYRDIYRPGKYRDLWFYWEGRPLIHANPLEVWRQAKDPQTDAARRRDLEEILRFFTFRPLQAGYTQGPTAQNQWSWLECYPQHAYGRRADGTVEMCAAGVAQNHSPKKMNGGRGLAAMNDANVFGRAYMGPSEAELRPGEQLYYGEDRNPHRGEPNRFLWCDNFAQQLAHARAIDPDYLFITGWNEYMATYFADWMGRRGAFPDQYSPAFSRDIEPSAGVMKDHAYYQFVDGVRAFRGVRPQRAAHERPVYRDACGDTLPRDAAGYGDIRYRDATGRNDITDCFVEHDAETIRLRVACAAPLTPRTDPAWMRLFLSVALQADDPRPNWNHFHFVVNRVAPPDDHTAVLEACTGGWAWREVARVPMKLAENTLEIAVPRAMIGQTARVDIRFKWADNTPGPSGDGDVLDFYRHGDAAPDGRFLYRYFER